MDNTSVTSIMNMLIMEVKMLLMNNTPVSSISNLFITESNNVPNG